MSDIIVSKPKRARSRKVKVANNSNKENVDPLAIAKPKRTRAVAEPKPVKEPRVKKQKPAMRVLHVDDHETQEAFDIPAHFTCSSCKKPHSIAEHVKPLPSSSKVYQTCQDCRDKGVEFYRRQKRVVDVHAVHATEAEGSADVAPGNDSAELAETA